MDTLQKEIEYSSRKAEWIENNFNSFLNEIKVCRAPIFKNLQARYDLRGRVLEIGAGSSWLGVLMSKIPEIKRVFVLDISKDLLEIANKKIIDELSGDRSKIEFVSADFNILPFENNGFDIIVCDASLHHAKNLSVLLKEIFRVLKKGGYLIAIREPIRPLVYLRKFGKKEIDKGATENIYSKKEWNEYFKGGRLKLDIVEDFSQNDFKTIVFRIFPFRFLNNILFSRYHFFAKKLN